MSELICGVFGYDQTLVQPFLLHDVLVGGLLGSHYISEPKLLAPWPTQFES